jgi:hypothetical protein
MKKINKSLVILSSVAMLTLLSGCGDDTTDDSASNISTALQDATTTTYAAESTNSYNGVTIISKLNATGDFSAIDGTYGPELVFADGVTTPYTVNTLTMTESIEMQEAAGQSVLSITSDFSEGTQHLQGNRAGYGNFDCVETYISPLPIILSYSTDDLPDYFDEDTRVSTTCPTWIDDNANDTHPISYTAVTNITVNGTSQISEYNSYK